MRRIYRIIPMPFVISVTLRVNGEEQVEIKGEKVIIRDNLSWIDNLSKITWSLDQEILSLDPPTEVYDTGAKYLAIDTIEGEHIGTIVLYHYDAQKQQLELGIRIGKKNYWGMGYGADAIRYTMWYYFTKTPVIKFYLKVLTSNTRAIKCYLNCGFIQVNRLMIKGYDFTIMELQKA